MTAFRTLRTMTAIGMALAVVTTTPAHAFLGGVLNSFFGGGGGGGCFADEGDGLLGAVGSAVSGLAGGGDPAGGCPIVESRPLVVEEMVHTQELELIAQTAHMLTQIDNLVAMRALSGTDTRDVAAARLAAARAVADRTERVRWSLDGVERQFAALYPDALPDGLSAAGVLAHRAEQARLARDASLASKQVSAEVMTALAGYPDRIRELVAAVKACRGQTCALDAGAQATLLNAELAGQLLVLQAAQGRAAEAQLDYEQAAIERARQNTIISWRGLATYGAPGS